MRVVVGITGASGAIYGWRLINALKQADCEVHAVVTDHGRQVLDYECGISPLDIAAVADRHYKADNMHACIASGSFKTDAMIIAPCSMRTLGAVANGISDNLLTRAADVTLKENRMLIVVPRETPVNVIHLGNMLKLAQIGVKIMPASPGFYHRPADLSALIDMMVGKICDMLNVEHNLYQRWTGE
jgi:4-hydroxy-3-polyprenylbenzoate decarboxylase